MLYTAFYMYPCLLHPLFYLPTPVNTQHMHLLFTYMYLSIYLFIYLSSTYLRIEVFI